jgi:hypothetical protein
MRRYTLAMIMMAIHITALSADPLTPLDARATSQFGAVEFLDVVSDIYVSHLIDNSGLIDIEGTPDNPLDDLHDFDAFWNSGWHSGDFDGGIPGGLDDDGDPFTAPLVSQQILEFDLGALAVVTHAHIWQQNQSGIGTALAIDRGVDEFEILYSDTTLGDTFMSVGSFNLLPEDGLFDAPAQVIAFADALLARRIRFQLTSAHSGLPNEFVGLGEVRFEGELLPTPVGDFNLDGLLDARDLDLLSSEIRRATNLSEYDLNSDALVDTVDQRVWVEELKGTYFGDANLDGQFNSSDLVMVLASGEYEDAIAGNSSWETGDWNADGDASTADLVVALAAGGYEAGPRALQHPSVPEPTALVMQLIGIVLLSQCRRGRLRPHSAPRGTARTH